jgi:hypothetical protein
MLASLAFGVFATLLRISARTAIKSLRLHI